MGKGKGKLTPNGWGPEFKRVEVRLPVTFHYNPVNGEVYFPRENKSATKVTDTYLLELVKEVYDAIQSDKSVQ